MMFVDFFFILLQEVYGVSGTTSQNQWSSNENSETSCAGFALIDFW